MILANKFLLIELVFIFGIFLAGLNFPFWFLVFISIFLFLKLKEKKFFALFIILILVFGFFYFHFRIFLKEKNQKIIFNQNIFFQAKIISPVYKYEKYQKFNLNLIKPFQGKVEVLTDFFDNYNYGDILSIEGIIEKNKNFYESPKIIFPKIKRIGFEPNSKIYLNLLKIKSYFLSQIKKYLSKDEAALASGILLGERTDFSDNLKEAMNGSGTTHIVALSGYNISVLILIFLSIFTFVFGIRKAIIFTLLFVLLFVFMVGLEASVVRAAIMGSLAILAKFFGKFYSFWHSVLFAAAIMILINPLVLFFDLGFQLSFLSLLGISYFKPMLLNIFEFKEDEPGFLNWKDNLTTTLAAQLGVAPLLLFKFNGFFITSFLANILILSFVPLVMALAFILGIFGIFSFLGFIVAIFLSFILKYQIFVMEIFSKMPKLNSNIFSIIIIFGIYLFLFVFNFKKQIFKI